MGTFQMPDFNFRLRRALNPFENQISPSQRSYSNPFDVSFDSPFSQQEDSSLPDLEMGQIPDYSQFYEDEGPAMSAFKSHLNKAPMPTEYAPSKWRRAGAILSGVSSAIGGGDGYSAARNIIRAPYEEAHQDWIRGGQGLKEAATMEESTANRRATNYQKLMDSLFDREDKREGRRIGWAGVDVQRERADIARQVAETDAMYKAGMLTETQARNRIAELTSKRNYDVGMANVGVRREANDIARYGINRRAYDATKGRELQERQGQYGPVTGGSQRAIEQSAIDAAYRAMISNPEYDVEKFFILDENDAPIMLKANLPPEIYTKYQNALNQGMMLAGRR